jgi:hypothetical protein
MSNCSHKYEHGPLYICEEYSEELKEKLYTDAQQFKINLHDPNWVAKQNVDPIIIEIFKLFMRD